MLKTPIKKVLNKVYSIKFTIVNGGFRGNENGFFPRGDFRISHNKLVRGVFWVISLEKTIRRGKQTNKQTRNI